MSKEEKKEVKPRVLIVGTVPYNEKSTSRAFDSYFHFWNKESLAQIFSNTKVPVKGHCSSLFQITDQRILKRWVNPNQKTGKVFEYDELPTQWTTNDLEVGSSLMSKLYNWGSKKNSIVYLLRGILWRKKFWCTAELNEWLDKFKPECVFLSFSDDFFILQIALYVAEKYSIPIVSSIGDDYYFNYKKMTISPLYHIYKLLYRKLVRRVFRNSKNAIYIGNKIRDKYNYFFGLKGQTVYLTSSIERREFRKIDVNNPIISYFGNIRLGRNESLNNIGYALGKIDKNFILNIYSNENDSHYYNLFKNNPNIKFHGSIPYGEVQRKSLESDILIVVEGFKKKDIDITRYSLSTKVADSLASGASVFAYGSLECGAIEYAKSIKCITTCSDTKELEKNLRKLIYDEKYQKINYENAKEIVLENHSLKKNTSIFEEIIKEAIKEG